MQHITALYGHNSDFRYGHVLNLLTFIIALSNLLFYFYIHANKNMSYWFIGLPNPRNSLFYLIIWEWKHYSWGLQLQFVGYGLVWSSSLKNVLFLVFIWNIFFLKLFVYFITSCKTYLIMYQLNNFCKKFIYNGLFC